MKLVINRADGGVSIMELTSEAESPETEISKWSELHVGELISWHELNDNNLPDQYFRNAWEYNDGLKINTDKARLIHMSHIREARNSALAELDIQTLRGVDVQTQKQILRDIPQTFDISSATTPEALKALWPSQLRQGI